MNKFLLVLSVALICALATSSSQAGAISASEVSYIYVGYPPAAERPENSGDDLANGYINGQYGSGLWVNDADWVQFNGGAAHLIFDLGSRYNLESIAISHWLGWGIYAPDSVDIKTSIDNVNWSAPVNKTGFQALPYSGDIGSVTSTFSAAGQARWVDVFVHAQGSSIFMLGELQFSGTPVPEPASMLLLGLGGLLLGRKK